LVVIAATAREAMVAHLRACAPDEGCGLAALRGDEISAFEPARNVHETPRTRYAVHPADLLRAADLEDSGAQIVIVHSHPASPARPSPTDITIAQQTWPDALYVIVSLASEEPDIAAWRLGGAEPERVPVTP
jgi:[CysO sulfur-carrier protein]-S-L-cysteine hydrolase